MLTAPLNRPPTLRLLEKPSPQVIQFLEKTIWGSSGLQYLVKDYASALSRLPNPCFFVLEDQGAISACVMFFIKAVSLIGRKVSIAYLTQLSVMPERRGQGIAHQLVKTVMDHMNAAVPMSEPTGVTAYIDEGNAPSLAVFEKQGFTTLGRFSGSVFNRVQPRRSNRVFPLGGTEVPHLRGALFDLYGDHILQDFDISLHARDYTVIRDANGRILAGVQAHTEEWRVTHMEGVGGWIATRALPAIPWIRRHVFNPEASRFLHLSHLYAEPGQEALLYVLMEDALARYNRPFAVLYVDKRSLVYQRMASAGSLGFLNPVMETPVRVTGWFRGFPKNDQEKLALHPMVISPLDIT